jgi:hypothetical protein
MLEGSCVNVACDGADEQVRVRCAAHTAGKALGCKFITKMRPDGSIDVWRSEKPVNVDNVFLAMKKGDYKEVTIPYVQEAKIVRELKVLRKMLKEATEYQRYEFDTAKRIDGEHITLQVWRLK